MRGANATARSVFDLFTFVRNEELSALRAAGSIPWWTDDRLRVSVFRPLTSLDLSLDHYALRDRVTLAHLHSAAWLVALVALVFALLRRRVSMPAALIGTAVVATHPAWTVTLHWLCNRAEVICGAAVLATWSLLERGSRRPLLAVTSAAGALAGEYSIAFGLLPLLVDWRLHREGRAKALAVFIALPVVLMALARGCGFQIRHSGTYVDPIWDAATFTRELPLRLLMMSDAVLMPWRALPSLVPWVTFAVIVAVAVKLAERRALVALYAAFLSLVPLAASVPAVRLLGPFALALGWAAAHLWETPVASPRDRTLRGAARLAIVSIVVVFALASHQRAREARVIEDRRLSEAMRAVESLRSEGVERGVIVSLSDPEALHMHALLSRLDGGRRIEWLVIAASARAPFLLRRSGLNRFELQSQSAPLLFAGDLYRSPRAPLREGESVRAGEVRFTAEDVVDGRPRRMVIEAAGLGEPGGVRLLRASGTSLQVIPSMAVNSAMVLPPG